MKSLVTILFLVAFTIANAQLRLPAIFSDHMVLQQQSEVTIWGWSSPGQKVVILASWSEDSVKTLGQNTSKWSAKLKTPAAGGPFRIRIIERNEVVLQDVMIGEVWICSGQSNMEWSVNNGAADAAEDMPKSNFPGIRLFHINKSTSGTLQDRGEGEWKLCTPESMKGFSAAGYFFAKKLHNDLKIPIGVINASWGGTPAEVWTPAEVVESDPELKAAAATITREQNGWPQRPGLTYNAMINPIVPYGIAGVIWYQGESNTGRFSSYAHLMEKMIGSWRNSFGKDFPFYFVQIAPYTGYGRYNEGALIQEQQAKTLKVPKTGMVIISDKVDNLDDIHPKFKKPVGERLAAFALSEVYNKPVLGYKSPVYKSTKVEKGKIRVSFDYADIGLISFGGDPKEFQVAGNDKKFYPAIAKIDGSTVVVSAKEVKIPVAVRYAWGNAIVSNLFNKEGLPVSIFRTDDWEVDTSNVPPKK